MQQTERGLEFRRFPESALRYYDTSPAWAVRARCPAGAALEFLTDSPTVFVSARLGEAARQAAYFDLYADGLFADCLGSPQPLELLEGERRCGAASAGPRRVTLYLPHVRQVVLQSIRLAEGASFEPASRRPLLFALGDSITQGMESAHPSLTYAAVAARELGLELANAGVGGVPFAAESLPERFVENPAIITVAYGINDWALGVPAEAARLYLQRLRALYPEVPVAVLAPLWSVEAEGPGAASKPGSMPVSERRAALAEFVRAFPNMTCLPMESLLPPRPDLLADGVHPSTAGQMVYGMNLARLLRAMVRPAASLDISPRADQNDADLT